MKFTRKLVTLMFGVMLCALLSVTAFASDYTVNRGDCLWRIANKTLGSGIRWTEIYEVNKDQIKDPHWIYPGQVFAIPDEISETATSASAASVEEAPAGAGEETASALPMAGAPTDYADESSWIALPEPDKAVDTLYFTTDCYHPYSADEPAVCTIDNRGMRVAARADLATNRSAYAETNVFAPYFRQVGVYNEKEVDKNALLREPRTDVYAALDYYFEHLNGGRAFQLAGHGQGAELIRIIQEEYLAEHPAYAARLTATYLE